MAGLISFTAFERYVFFCKPFKYTTIITSRVIAVIVTAVLTVPFVYMLSIDLSNAEEQRADYYNLLGYPLRLGIPHRMVLVFGVILPSTSITVVCIHKIRKLALNGAVAPAVVNVLQQQHFQPLPSPVQQAKKLVRMVLLVSGVYWGSYLPSSLVLSYFTTFQDQDRRQSKLEVIIIRISIYIFTCLSSLLNPFIYYYSRRELRQALRKLLVRRQREANPVEHIVIR